MLSTIFYLFKDRLSGSCCLFWPLYFILIISLACSRNEKVVYLKPHLDKKVSVLSDSSFFANCNDVIFFNDSLLITDVKNNRVVICDTAFNLVANIAKAGNGPGEMILPTRSFLSNNHVHTFDGGNRALSLFTKKGKFLKRITYPSSRFIPDTRFAIDGSSKIFVSDTNLERPMAALDTTGHIVRQFGSFFSSKSSIERRFRSSKHIFLSNEQLICVGVSEPLIEIYTKNGKKVREFNLAKDAHIKESVDYMESKRQKNPEIRETSYFMLFSDAYLVNNHLYILHHSITKDKRGWMPGWIPDKILVYTLGTTLEFHKAFDLDDGGILWCDTFAVSEDEKRTFASVGNRNEWHVFSIPPKVATRK